MNIKITPIERLILANQYQIIGALKNDQSAMNLADSLRDGYEYMYRELLEGLLPEMDKETTDFVLDALSLYQAMKDSWVTLGEPHQVNRVDVEWQGFDGNNEARLFGFTRALAADNRFPEQLGEQGKNSHLAVASIYKRMLTKWGEQGRPRHPMTLEQIQAVLAARGY